MHPSALRGPLIRVVQAAQDGHRAYRPLAALGLRRQRLGQRLPETLVRPHAVEVGDVLAERAAQVALAEDEQVVKALAADAAEEALADGVRSRGADRRAQDRDLAGCGDAREGRPELAVVVADQVAGMLIVRGRLAQLPGHPGVGRVPRHAEMDDAP